MKMPFPFGNGSVRWLPKYKKYNGIPTPRRHKKREFRRPSVLPPNTPREILQKLVVRWNGEFCLPNREMTRVDACDSTTRLWCLFHGR